MAFDALSKVKFIREYLIARGTQRAMQFLNDVNLVLALLPDAGYEIGDMEVEFGHAPKVTIGLKLGRAINEARLKSIQEKMDNAMLAAILSSLIQASKLQDAVSLETLALQDVKVVMTASPTVSLLWKQKVVVQAAAVA
jgi:hypothetical protein